MRRRIEMILSIIFIGISIIFIISYLEYKTMYENNNEIEEDITYIKEIDIKMSDKIKDLNSELDKHKASEANKIEEYNIWEFAQKELTKALSS